MAHMSHEKPSKKLWKQRKHACSEVKPFMMSSRSRKYCLHAMCVKITELYYVCCCAYFAVVSSTNRLTRLFSRVLKYCGERRGFQSGNLTTTDTELAQREHPPESPNLHNSNELMSGRLKTQRTGSAVFGEKRQKPGRRQQQSQTHRVTENPVPSEDSRWFTRNYFITCKREQKRSILTQDSKYNHEEQQQ